MTENRLFRSSALFCARGKLRFAEFVHVFANGCHGWIDIIARNRSFARYVTNRRQKCRRPTRTKFNTIRKTISRLLILRETCRFGTLAANFAFPDVPVFKRQLYNLATMFDYYHYHLRFKFSFVRRTNDELK